MFRLLILVLLLNFSCTTVTIYNPHSDKNIILTHDVSQCYSKRIFKKWTAFYGAVALNKIDPNDMFPTENFAYRITEEATGEDALISFFLGLFTTISRKSIIVDFCTPPLQMTKPETKRDATKTVSPERKEKESQKEQDIEKYSSKGILNNPIYIGSNNEELLNLLENLERKIDSVSNLQRQLESELNDLKSFEKQLGKYDIDEQSKTLSNSPEEADQVIYLKGKRKIIIAGEEENSKESAFTPILSDIQPRKSGRKVLGSVFFPTNSYKLTASARARLQKILDSHRGKIQLIGYADVRGSNYYNYLISKRRALMVKQEISKLLGNVQINISALGASKFKKERNLTPTRLDWQRRVDIVLLSEE